MFQRLNKNNTITKENKNEAVRHVLKANDMLNQHYCYASHLFAATHASVRHYQLAIKLDPGCIDAYLELSSVSYYLFGAGNQALKYLDQALEVVPNNLEIISKKIAMLECLNRIPEALFTTEKAMLFNPTVTVPLFQDHFIRLAQNQKSFSKYMSIKQINHDQTKQSIRQEKSKITCELSVIGLFSADKRKVELNELVADYGVNIVAKP